MRRQLGVINKYEFAVFVAIFGILAAVLMVRLNAMQGEAERMEFELTLRNMRVGIQHAVSERILRGEEQRIVEVVQANPLEFLVRDRQGHPDGQSAGGPEGWEYDPVRRELQYRPRMAEAFADAGPLRWRYAARRDSSGRIVGATLEGLN